MSKRDELVAARDEAYSTWQKARRALREYDNKEGKK